MARPVKKRVFAGGALLALVVAGYASLKGRAAWSVPEVVSGKTGGDKAGSETANGQATVIEVEPKILHDDVKRLGINLGGVDFYDSLQTLKNLVSRNPGFEGMEWQSVIQCGQVTATSCTDAANSGSWPSGFLDGGSYEVISGSAARQTGSIVASTAANSQTGATIRYAQSGRSPAANDFIVVRKATAGDATAGWGPQTGGGATITTEYHDLSPKTPGSQAVRLRATGPDQSASLKAYFDSTPGRSYVQLRGPYVIHFRAKGVAGNDSLIVAVERAWTGAAGPIFRQAVPLTNKWQDYTLRFDAAEPTSAVGTVAFEMSVYGAEVLVDDASLEEGAPNGTAFRNDVVATLERLKPGTLRYMDSGGNWGSSLDNLLAPEDARRRTGYNRYFSDSGDIPMGLHDFLVLCEKIGAEPWFTIPMGLSSVDAAGLMEYLGGAVATPYGARRATLGHAVPWTKSFKEIHLEYGNEAWNTAQPGAAMPDAAAYAQRATTMFSTMRAAALSGPGYTAGRFDLILNGQAVNPFLTAKLLDTAKGMDTIDIAPYLFSTFADDSSTERIFGPMFAEPEMIDSAVEGYVHKQASAAAGAAHPVRMAVYETNMGTVEGTASQVSIDKTVPSLGAGLAAVDHMLLMLRDLGIRVQNTFQLGGGNYHFHNTAGGSGDEMSPVWAVVVDMGGPTNRVRPSFLAQQMANEAIRPVMLATEVKGNDPTWDQPLSANDKVQLNGAHELQTFAFADDAGTSVILLNLSRTKAHPVALAGICAPQGVVRVQTLTSASITDTNEQDDKVRIVSREDHDVAAGKTMFLLPPFSMTTLSSRSNGCVPARGPAH